MDKQNLSVIVIFVLSVLALGAVFAFIAIQNETGNRAINLTNVVSINNNTISQKDIVIIKDGKIENEQLIDKFIEEAVAENNENKELNIVQDEKIIKVTYTPGEYASAMLKQSQGEDIATGVFDGSTESKKNAYGYYTLFVNDEIQGEFPLIGHHIKRTTSNDTIILYFDAPLIDYATIPEICRYNLKSSNYTKKFYMVYNQRKDLGIKTVFNTGEYEVKTFGGDVQVVIDDDMVYNLEDALSKKVITPDDILEQAKIDAKYGICQSDSYDDGGSTEFMYKDFTILKLNTLDGDKDLVIGMKGQIIDLYNKNK